jgi:hypothetical protein
LHVPINIPALGVSLNEDNVDTNRELVAHGLSNMLSGLVGSVQSTYIERDQNRVICDYINISLIFFITDYAK